MSDKKYTTVTSWAFVSTDGDYVTMGSRDVGKGDLVEYMENDLGWCMQDMAGGRFFKLTVKVEIPTPQAIDAGVIDDDSAPPVEVAWGPVKYKGKLKPPKVDDGCQLPPIGWIYFVYDSGARETGGYRSDDEAHNIASEIADAASLGMSLYSPKDGSKLVAVEWDGETLWKRDDEPFSVCNSEAPDGQPMTEGGSHGQPQKDREGAAEVATQTGGLPARVESASVAAAAGDPADPAEPDPDANLPPRLSSRHPAATRWWVRFGTWWREWFVLK